MSGGGDKVPKIRNVIFAQNSIFVDIKPNANREGEDLTRAEQFYKRYELGRISTEDFLKAYCEFWDDAKMGLVLTPEKAQEFWLENIGKVYDQRILDKEEDSLEVLRAKNKGIKLLLLARTDPLRQQLIQETFCKQVTKSALPFDRAFMGAFDKEYFSYNGGSKDGKMGLDKAKPECYRYILEDQNLADQNIVAAETLFVSTNTEDLRAAKAAGLNIYLYDPDRAFSQVEEYLCELALRPDSVLANSSMGASLASPSPHTSASPAASPASSPAASPASSPAASPQGLSLQRYSYFARAGSPSASPQANSLTLIRAGSDNSHAAMMRFIGSRDGALGAFVVKPKEVEQLEKPAISRSLTK
jgi:hypothetical protein